MSNTLEKLAEIIEARSQSDGKRSYVAELKEKGLNKILEKVGEETIEVILAAKDTNASDNQHLINETADLLFHLMVMLSCQEVDYREVLAELERRMGTSGLAEKRSRSQA